MGRKIFWETRVEKNVFWESELEGKYFESQDGNKSTWESQQENALGIREGKKIVVNPSSIHMAQSNAVWNRSKDLSNVSQSR